MASVPTLSFRDARACVIERVAGLFRATGADAVGLDCAAGRVLAEDMRAHGMPSFNEMGGQQADKVEAALATRTAEALKKPDGGKSFFLLPLGTLFDEKNGMLATLRADGVKVTPVA